MTIPRMLELGVPMEAIAEAFSENALSFAEREAIGKRHQSSSDITGPL